MDSRIGRLLCLLVVMGMAGCNDAEMKKFVWTVRMLVFGAGGLVGAVVGLVVSLVHNSRNPEKIGLYSSPLWQDVSSAVLPLL